MTYECHITLDLPDEPLFTRLTEFAEEWGWSASWIDGDPVLGEKRFFYLTRYGENFKQLRDEMTLTATVVEGIGFPVVRRKIEAIVYDTKGA